jgi:formylglycine-generating enzyme
VIEAGLKEENMNIRIKILVIVVLVMSLVSCSGGRRKGSGEEGSPIQSINHGGDKQTFTADGESFNMVYVPCGISFPIGLNDDNSASINKAYWIGETEVTYGLFSKVRTWAQGKGYSFGDQAREGHDGVINALSTTFAKDEPVTNISWRDALIFTNALTEWYNEQTGSEYEPVYYSDSLYNNPLKISSNDPINCLTQGCIDNPYIKEAAKGFRLLSTDEWEGAARYMDGTEWTPGTYASGAESTHENDVKKVAVCDVSGTAKVKSKEANALGLYDMNGNVFEWLFDWYPELVNGESQVFRIRRGGGYSNEPTNSTLKVGYRSDAGYVGYPVQVLPGTGFRLGRTDTGVICGITNPYQPNNNLPSSIEEAGTLYNFSADGVSFKMAFVPGGLSSFINVTDLDVVPQNDYLVGETEVTYQLWDKVRQWAQTKGYVLSAGVKGGFTGTACSSFIPTNQHPVTTITWKDAIVFCNALTQWYNEQEGTNYSLVYYVDSNFSNPLKSNVGGIPKMNPNATGFRLPIGTEWEVAARYKDGISWTSYNYPSGGDSTNDYMNFAVYGTNKTEAVKSKQSNLLNTYDMSGNVREFSFDYVSLDAISQISDEDELLIKFIQCMQTSYNNCSLTQSCAGGCSAFVNGGGFDDGISQLKISSFELAPVDVAGTFNNVGIRLIKTGKPSE